MNEVNEENYTYLNDTNNHNETRNELYKFTLSGFECTNNEKVK